MKNNYLKKHTRNVLPFSLLSVAITTCIGLWPLTCLSGAKNDAEKISDNLTEWIKSGSFSYDSKAKTYKTDSRYVFSGGEYSLRNPIYRINPVQVSLPDINHGMGCSGIDLYMGSFSFITKEELKNFAKATIKGAPVYAFNLALNSMDPDIKNEIDKLRNLTHMLSAGQLDSCTAAQYGVNSIATLFNNERMNKQIGERSIQHLYQSLYGESSSNNAFNYALNNYIPFAGKNAAEAAKEGDSTAKTVEVKDKSVREIAASTQIDVCGVASDNFEAANGKNTDCEIVSETQAMGYEKSGQYGNLMRLSSESWISAIRNKNLFENTPLFPAKMSDEAIRSFIYSLFGTGYTLFTDKTKENKNQKCIVDTMTTFSSEEATITATVLIEGGTYPSLVSNNPENKKGSEGKEFCWLIDTNFRQENVEWTSPGKRILEKLGDFGSIKYQDSKGRIDPSSSGYKKLSEETIIGNVYFSSTTEQGSIRDWTPEELKILDIFPANFKQALNNKTGVNSPLLIYTAAKECLKPTLTDAYKSLFGELKKVVTNAVNDYPSNRLNKANKEKTIQHINLQYNDLIQKLDEYGGSKTPIECVNDILRTPNITANQPAIVK